MWQYLLHLWQPPPQNLALACPASAAGTAAPPGIYDPDTVARAFGLTAGISVILVILAVVGCYQLTRGSLGRSFVARWWIWVGVAGLLCLGATAAILATAPTTALTGSCSTMPFAFAARLPTSLIISRSLAGLVWGLLAFMLFSLVLASSVGRISHRSNGFFHNRGCPWPRFLP